MSSSQLLRKSRNSNKYFTEKNKFNQNCEYCQCKCLQNNHRDKNNNTKKKQKLKGSMKSIKNFRDCVILNDIGYGLPQSRNVTGTSWPSAGVGELCESMQTLCLAENVFNAYKKVPVHDQRILNRMARSRRQKAVLTENAWLAQKFWENEKYDREIAKCEEEEAYKKIIKRKQMYDSYITQARLQTLHKRNQEELQKLRETLAMRDSRVQNRLKNLKLQKKIQKCEQSEHELCKTESVLDMLQRQQVSDALLKHDVYSSLQCKISRADMKRQKHLDTYTRRLKHDNYMEQIMHEENYRETKKFEELRNEELKQYIKNKDRRSKSFVEWRRKNFRDALERAKISASLRELVRRSVSPDGLQHGTARQMYERPSSTLSYECCIKLK